MHRVLERQIKRYLGERAVIPPEWLPLLKAVSDAYASSEEDRALLDRSLELSSKEFSETNRQLREAKEKTEQIVQERTRELEHALSDLQIQKGSLETAKAQDEAILLSIGDGLVATDKDGAIILANKVFERLLGWTVPEVRGKKMVEVVPHEDVAGNRTPVEERPITLVLMGESSATLTKDFYYVRKDGTRFPAAGTTTPILLNGTIVGAVVVFRDVTKEKELDRAKTDFISLASHQLRTPLSSMKWVMELLLQQKEGLSEKQLDKLNDLHTSNERLIQLVNSLLNIARMETGKLQATKKPARITDLIQSSCRLIKPSADKKGQSIHCDVRSDVAESAVDPMLFDEAFNNLLSNAINYGAEGTDIRVTVDRKDGEYLVSVNSHGLVITPEDQERLFTKFFRSAEARSAVSAGTGLGLYIAKAAVEANGGKIWVDSTAENGTTFFFTVPLS
jgi:PAS domain S-box-containing protein